MKIIKKTLKWVLILFFVWLTYQGLVYGYWLHRGWNDSNLGEDIDNYMENFSSDELFKKVQGMRITIIDPYRDHAMGILVERKDRRIVPILIKEMKSWNIDVRHAAIMALGDIGDERAIEPLMEIVKKAKIDYSYNGSRTPDYIVALEALAKMKYEPVYRYAIEFATSKKEPNNLKNYGVMMLGYFEKPEALPILKKIAEEEKNYRG